MNKFIKKFAFFITPIVILIFLIEIYARKIPNDYHLKKQYLDSNASKIQTLILGNSHTYYGVDPVYIDGTTFNASYVSQSLKQDFEIFEKYKPQFTSLKNIVIPISYFSLFNSSDKGLEAWRKRNYVVHYKIGEIESYKDLFEISGNFRTLLRKMYSYYIKDVESITSSTLGWGVNYSSLVKTDLKETGKAAATRHTSKDINSKEELELFEENIELLKSFIKSCNSLKISVIFITTPVFETYTKSINPLQLEKTTTAIKKLVDINDLCLYLNLIDDKRFSSVDFYDADHLNEIGARKMTYIIKEYLK